MIFAPLYNLPRFFEYDYNDMEICYCKNETNGENTLDLTSDMCTDYCAGVTTKLRDNYFYKLVIINLRKDMILIISSCKLVYLRREL